MLHIYMQKTVFRKNNLNDTKEALQKAEEFEKEFGKKNTYSASLNKIKEKTKAELAQINIEQNPYHDK